MPLAPSICIADAQIIVIHPTPEELAIEKAKQAAEAETIRKAQEALQLQQQEDQRKKEEEEKKKAEEEKKKMIEDVKKKTDDMKKKAQEAAAKAVEIPASAIAGSAKVAIPPNQAEKKQKEEQKAESRSLLLNPGEAA